MNNSRIIQVTQQGLFYDTLVFYSVNGTDAKEISKELILPKHILN